MADAGEKIAADLEFLDRTLEALSSTLNRPYRELTEWMAAAGFLHSVHEEFENRPDSPNHEQRSGPIRPYPRGHAVLSRGLVARQERTPWPPPTS